MHAGSTQQLISKAVCQISKLNTGLTRKQWQQIQLQPRTNPDRTSITSQEKPSGMDRLKALCESANAANKIAVNGNAMHCLE